MKRKNTNEDMECAETVKLITYSEDQKNSHAQGGTRGIDSDEENDDDPRLRGGR